MKYIVYNSTGEILRVGDCPEDAVELQAQPGELLALGSADPSVDAVDPATGTVVIGGRQLPEPRRDTYADVRRRMYPSTSVQLDMLWHAMDSLQIPKAEPFYSAIKAVKDAVPKGADEIFDVDAH